MKLHKILFIIVFTMSAVNALTTESLPFPYNLIGLLPPDYHGWFLPENKRGLERIISAQKPEIVFELGSWLGASTIFIGERLKESGVVYAIDNWNRTGSPGVQSNPEWRSRLKTLFQQFLSNVIHKGLAHKIIPIRMDIEEAAAAIGFQADMIYVDASHAEEDVFNDVMNFYPLLKVGGIMCGDDWNWKSVQRGVGRASNKLGQVIHSDGNFWYFDSKA